MYQVIRINLSDNSKLAVGEQLDTQAEAKAKLIEWLTLSDAKHSYEIKEIRKRGRPKKEKTVPVRVPESLVSEVKALIRKHREKPPEALVLTADPETQQEFEKIA